MRSTPHIAVIGAGIAGLSCATALQQAGLRVSVFDKSRGPAGRMSTRREDDWQCDHGAQYFTARDPAFRAEVARWQHAGVAGLWTPRLQVLGTPSLHNTDPNVERFVGIPRMTAPARLLADALLLERHITVEKLQREVDSWRLISVEQGLLADRFDAVLLAIPAPQTVPLLNELAPELASLARSATMRGCWALMLRFAASVDLPFDAAFVNEGPLGWIARDSSKPGRNGPETWLLHARAEWSEAHLEQSADYIAAELMKAFAALGGPAPQAWTAHRWRYADTLPALDEGCAWDVRSKLGLCGDWLNGGKVQGAWLSGKKLAEQVLELHIE